MEDESRRVKVASVFSSMHTSVVGASARMLVELKRYNYVTPTNFLELVKVWSWIDAPDSRVRLQATRTLPQLHVCS